MAQRYDIIFRGDVAPGHNIVEVRDGVRDLFKLDEAKVEQLFSGRPVALRRDVDAATAEKFRSAMGGVGAIVELKPLAQPQEPPPASPPPSHPSPSPRPSEPLASGAGADVAEQSGDFDIAPVGADVLKPDERRPKEAPAVTTDHLAVEPAGADVLRPEERHSHADREIDVSHLDIEKPE